MCSRLPLTRLLHQWRAGDAASGDRLLAAVQNDLHAIARRALARENNITLEPGDLVNETFIRLLGPQTDWKDRGHFFALVARTMRRILVDHARQKNRIKRGRDATKITLHEERHSPEKTDIPVLALDEALTDLEAVDPRQSKIVELRIFVGLTIQEIAEVLCISTRTVDLEWRMVKAWLFGRLQGEL